MEPVRGLSENMAGMFRGHHKFQNYTSDFGNVAFVVHKVSCALLYVQRHVFIHLFVVFIDLRFVQLDDRKNCFDLSIELCFEFVMAFGCLIKFNMQDMLFK